MLVEIKGYRNIEKLKYNIEENKMNLLFGVSGSGKSSIAMAMQKVEFDFNKKIDYKGDVEVYLDGSDVNETEVMIFNSYSVDKYLSYDDSESVFNIIIDDEKELSKYQDEFDNYMIRFKNEVNNYQDAYNELKTITKSLVGTLTAKNQVRSSATIKKLEKNFNGKTNTRIINEMNSFAPGRLEWIIEGKNFIEGDVCPFCEKKLNQKRINKIIKYSEFDVKNLKLVRDNSKKFILLGIKSPTYTSNGIIRLSDDLQNAAIAVKEFEKLLVYLDNIDDEPNSKGLNEIIIAETLYKFFPKLRTVINRVNGSISSINKKIENLHSRTKTVLSNKVSSLNNDIQLLGIPYAIEVKYKKGKIKEYKLKLLNDTKEDDRKKSLSNGERNLISLLLFVLDAKKRNDCNLVIIDDPVSSYDEHRRKLIFDFIKDNLKTKTVLIMSHDSVFARIAANVKKQELNRKNKSVGTIYYFENVCGEVKLIEICDDDFKQFEEFIINRVKSVNDYYLKIVNLRMLYEKSRGFVYGYLSEILHMRGRVKLDSWLENKKTTEGDILKRIEDDKKISLPIFKDDYINNIEFDDYSLIEKAAFVRERIGKKKTNFRNELNHIMHVNDRQIVCLDPHKYSFCSSVTRDEIETVLSGFI